MMRVVMKRIVVVLLAITSFVPAAHAAKVQEVVSPGGIRAWLVEEHALPLLAVKLAFTESGSAHDPDGKEGLTGMVAALLLEGAGDLDSNRFNAQVENLAIQMNFSADEDTLRASVEMLSEHKEKAFGLVGMALSAPRFDEAAIERVRSQSLSVITGQEQEPGYIMQRRWAEMAFGNHPYSKPSLGTPEGVAAVKQSDLANFAKRHLTRENLLVAVVGDITPAQLGTLLDTHLGALPAKFTPERSIEEVRLPEKAQQKVIDFDIPQSMVLFGANGLKREHPDYYAAYVMNHILGGGGALTSRLGVEIRQKRGLAYGVGSQLDPMMHSASWRGSFATRNEKTNDALAVLRDTLRSFSKNGPSDKELSDAKQHIIGAFVLSLDSNSDIANFLISMQLNHLGSDYLEKRNKLMEAVTKQQVISVALRLLNPDNLLVAIVGRPDFTK